MNPVIFILTTLFAFSRNITSAQNFQDIKQTLIEWNNAVVNKDVEKGYNIFDSSAIIIFAGSSKPELFKGNAEIRKFLTTFFARPFRLS
jgi:ketosteroid isomerase-like protein